MNLTARRALRAVRMKEMPQTVCPEQDKDKEKDESENENEEDGETEVV